MSDHGGWNDLLWFESKVERFIQTVRRLRDWFWRRKPVDRDRD